MEYAGTFSIGRKETTRFSKQIVMGKNQIFFFVFTAVGLICGNFLIRTLRPNPSMTAQILASFAGGVVVLGICYGGILYSVVRSELNAYTAGRRWTYKETLQIGPTEVRCTTDEESDSVDFGAVVVHETKEDFYFYIARESAWILPKGQLQDPERDQETIRKILRANVEADRLFLRREKKQA
jgi:hypothetical protein